MEANNMNTRGHNPSLYKHGNNWCIRFRGKDGKLKFAVVCPIDGPGAIKNAIDRDLRKREILAGLGLVQGEMFPELKANILFREAATNFVEAAQHRNRKPLKPATVKSYCSYLSNHLLPTIGDLPLAQINNKQMK